MGAEPKLTRRAQEVAELVALGRTNREIAARQALVDNRRLPSAIASMVLSVVMALVIGVALGYAIKPAAIVSGPARTIFVPVNSAVTNSPDTGCVFINRQKAC